MILTEYDEEKHIKNVKQESWEEGKIEGKIEGIAKGENRLIELMNILISAEKYDDIRKAMTDPEYRRELYVRYGIKCEIFIK